MADQLNIEDFITRMDRAKAQLLAPPRSLLTICRVAIIADSKKNFDQSSDPDGKPWLPLAHTRVRGGTKPLRDTGLLAGSLGHGIDHVERMTDNELVIGSNRAGARLHQYGGTIRPKRGKFLAIPATKEAARQTARLFPRVLKAIFGESASVGVLIETKVKKFKRKADVITTIVQYFLTKRVVVPARPFSGAGQRLIATLTRLTTDYWGRMFKGG